MQKFFMVNISLSKFRVRRYLKDDSYSRCLINTNTMSTHQIMAPSASIGIRLSIIDLIALGTGSLPSFIESEDTGYISVRAAKVSSYPNPSARLNGDQMHVPGSNDLSERVVLIDKLPCDGT